jgi:hypothetical protein
MRISAEGAREDRFIAALLACLAIACAGTATAAEDSLATDRPDFVESSAVVGKGVLQVETSLAYERDRRDGITTRTRTTPTLLRLGVADALELRLETDGFTRVTAGDGGARTSASGMSDTALGLKWHIRDGGETIGRPALALLAHLEANTGSSALRGSGVVPSLRLVAEWDLADDAAFGVMPGVAWQKDEAGARHWTGILAATYSRPIAERMRAFVELAGRELRAKRHGGNQVTFDTGITFAIDRDTQIDAAVVIGANRVTPDAALTAGYSRRFR